MLNKWEELRLIARCVAGDDRQAFGQLVEEYNDGLRRFLLNLTLGDASLTDDLAQETFIKVYLSLRSYQGIARFRTWLYRIAYNEFTCTCDGGGRPARMNAATGMSPTRCRPTTPATRQSTCSSASRYFPSRSALPCSSSILTTAR